MRVAKQVKVHLPFPGKVEPHFTALFWSERLPAWLPFRRFWYSSTSKNVFNMVAQGEERYFFRPEVVTSLTVRICMRLTEKRWDSITEKVDPVLQLLRLFAFTDIC